MKLYFIRKFWNLIPFNLKKPFYFCKGYLEQGKIVYQVKTPYNLLQVIDKKGYRYLVFKDPGQPLFLQKPEAIYQSYMDLKNPLRTNNIPFADYFHLAWVFSPQLITVLMIGLGGGTVPKRFLSDYPETSFTTVEIDPEVVRVAYRYFSLPRNPRHRVVINDGRKFIQQMTDPVDLILLDAFFARSIPYHLFTAEFFQEVSSRLTAKGLLGINFNGALTGSNSTLFRSLYRTLKAVFPRLYVFTANQASPRLMQNIIFFAPKEDLDLAPTDIFQRAEQLARSKVTVKDFAKKAKDLFQAPVLIQDMPVLSDAYPPLGEELDLYTQDVPPGKGG